MERAIEDLGAGVEVGILGWIRATVAGQEVNLGGPRQQALLAVLAARAGRSVANDVLIDAIWDGAPPDAADRTFRSYVARLRRAFDRAGVEGSTVIVTASGGYRLDDAVDVDAGLFEAEVARARDHLGRGQLADAVQLTGAALDRWEGPAFGRFADHAWAAPAAVRLEEQRLGATELRTRALLDADRVPQALALLEELTVAEPYRESVAQLHALALHRSGRDADAMRVIREFRTRLVAEHGLDPSDRLLELESMVLDRDPRLDRPVGGRRVRGFVLHEPIARSPLGTVHRAEQPSVGREVAVTALSASLADDPGVIRAFEARLQGVAGLEHLHVLPVYDYWREPGAAYVVTRLPARTLEQGLRAGRLSPVETLLVGEQIASALAAAHERGVVHGAIGTDAVALDGRGEAFLWAFPLTADQARPADDIAALATLVTDLAAGTAGQADERGVLLDMLSAPVRDVLSRAVEPGGGPVVTAAALSAALAAARTGASDVPVPAVEVGPNPYRGLAAFRETDADVFFGRDSLTDTLLAKILRNRVVAVIGPSGSGKSSVVRAGLLPRLRAQGAYVTTMRPGAKPLAELEVALSRVAAVELVDAADEVASRRDGLSALVRRVLPTPGADLVLVVDQFEELFTVSDGTEADLFLTALVDAAADHDSPVRVVVTLRADFLSAALSHPVAGPLVRDRSVMVGPLDDDELHEVVVRPSQVVGVAVEPALATALVADAARSPGSLPMVQFALTEIFEAAADEGTMALDAYRRIGGIEGVLGQRAEEVFASLDHDGQDATRAMFQRLVVANTDGPPTRRRALRTELERVPGDVIEVFGHARLLRFDHEEGSREPVLEVSHEALFRAWPRLATWIEEDEDDLRLLEHLTMAAAEWDAGGRDDAELYRGTRLDGALEFASTHRGQLPAIEEDFLRAGRLWRERERASTRRRVRRLRLLTGGLAVGLGLALVAGGFAWDASRQEEATARSAQVDELAYAAAGEVAEDPERASLLAAQAYALEPDIESQAALLDALDVEPRIISLRPTPFDTCSEPTGDADVVLFSTVTPDGEVLELRTLDQQVIRRLDLPASTTISCAGVTPSVEHVFIRYFDQVVVYDLDMQPVASRDDLLVADDIRMLTFHPTRPEAAAVLDSGTVAIITVPGLETQRVLDLDLDGEIATCPAGQVSQTGEPVLSSVRSVIYSEDASLLAVADGESVRVVDDTGRTVASTRASPHPSGCAYPFVSSGAGVFGHLARRSLVVAPLAAPGEQAEIELSGLTTPYRQAVAVEPGGRRAAVPTERGVEIVDLVEGTLVGQPIAVDANIIGLFWTAEGRLAGLGPNGLHSFDVDRSLVLGEVVAELGPGEADSATVVASDGSGVILAGQRSTFVAPDSDTDVALGANAIATALTGGRWFTLDPAEGIAAAGDAAGVTASRDIAGVSDVKWDSTTIEVGGDRVVTLLRNTDAAEGSPDRSVVLVFDADSAELLRRITPPENVTWTAAVPLSDDRVLVGDLGYEWRVFDSELAVVDGPRRLGAGYEVAAADLVDGRYVMADWSGSLHLVDPARDVVIDLTGPASYAFDVAFADDNRLVSRHIDGSTYVWDTEARGIVGRLWQSAPFTFTPIAVDRSADDLLQVTPAGLARIPLAPDRWFQAVCSRVDRQLTEAELAAIAPDLEPGPGC